MGGLYLDTETYKEENGKWKPILSATGEHVVCISIVNDYGKEKSFKTPKQAWDFLLKRAWAERKRGKILRVYMHNAKYDAYNIIDIEDRNIIWRSEKPFLMSYITRDKKEMNYEQLRKWEKWAKRNGKKYTKELHEDKVIIEMENELIKFMDTYAIFTTSAEKLGEMIKHPKMEMPKEINLNKEKDYEKLREYCENDCKLIREAIIMLKMKLKEKGVKLRNLSTVGQIAISYIMKKLREKGTKSIIDENGNIIKSEYAEKIHGAYRSGLVRVWKTGKIENLYCMDCNSLYPYCIANMKMPDLRTEKITYNPKKTILKEIGISRVMMKNENDEIGLLPIRTINKSYIPKKGKYLIGTYTNKEISTAIENGYRLIKIAWSITYEEGENPFKEIYEELYEQRIKNNESFNKMFYKMIMNSSIGKMGQKKNIEEIFIDSVENADKYLEENCKIIKGIDNTTNMLYMRETKTELKKYYNPIIPTLVTAESRIIMYNLFKKINIDDLVYSDTDSIITTKDYSKIVEINNKMGGFKWETDMETGKELKQANGIIWGTKSKIIGKNITIAGVTRKSNEYNEKDEKIKFKKMNTLKTNKKELGKFSEEERDLKKQTEEYIKSERNLEVIPLYIDKDIIEIKEFTEEVSCITS